MLDVVVGVRVDRLDHVHQLQQRTGVQADQFVLCELFVVVACAAV